MDRHYYKRTWSEHMGEALTDSWGNSVFYLETDETHYVIRQMQLFENGLLLKYTAAYADDQWGGLADQELDPEEFATYRIPGDVFEQLWQTKPGYNIALLP